MLLGRSLPYMYALSKWYRIQLSPSRFLLTALTPAINLLPWRGYAQMGAGGGYMGGAGGGYMGGAGGGYMGGGGGGYMGGGGGGGYMGGGGGGYMSQSQPQRYVHSSLFFESPSMEKKKDAKKRKRTLQTRNTPKPVKMPFIYVEAAAILGCQGFNRPSARTRIQRVIVKLLRTPQSPKPLALRRVDEMPHVLLSLESSL